MKTLFKRLLLGCIVLFFCSVAFAGDPQLEYTYEKVDDYTMKLYTVVTDHVVETFTLNDLLGRKKNFEAEIVALTDKYNTEKANIQYYLDQINEYIVEAQKLAIQLKP